MNRFSRKISALIAAAVAVATACTDAGRATAPDLSQNAVSAQGAATTPSNGLLGTVTGSLPLGNVISILGKLPQLTDIHASAVIGPAGGELAIPQTGLTLVVPRGAVSTNVKFEVTALKGLSVAYEFEPHGMKFNQPLTLRQDLRKTLFLPGFRLNGGYFKNSDQLDLLRRQGTVDESIRSLLNLNDWTVEFPVWHFSGYLVSCG
ncbi:MAG: hypothetical protein U0132_15415 [Gemmatimonadaceae bacterium]